MWRPWRMWRASAGAEKEGGNGPLVEPTDTDQAIALLKDKLKAEVIGELPLDAPPSAEE